MPAIPAKLVEDTARELSARAAIDIPPDFREGIRLARDREVNPQWFTDYYRREGVA